MKDIDSIFRDVENLSPDQYTHQLDVAGNRILPVLQAFSQAGYNGSQIFASLVIGATVADGELDEAEYKVFGNILDEFFGRHLTLAESRRVLDSTRQSSEKLKQSIDSLIDSLLQHGYEDTWFDMIYFCLLLCAVDGRVSPKEREWIKELIRNR